MVCAVDFETAELRWVDEIWRVERDEVENWSTPLVWKNDLRTEIVTSGRRKIRSYDLDGELLWERGGLTVNDVPTPFAKHGLVYISAGYPGGMPRPVYTVRPGATRPSTPWRSSNVSGYSGSLSAANDPANSPPLAIWTTMYCRPSCM